MAAIEDLTYDLATARRPSIEDLGGVGFVDDEAHPPPRDGTYLYKEVVIQLVKQVHALAKMVPLFRMTVDFNAGAPYILTLDCPSEVLVAGDFTLTDNGTGDVTIEWTADDVPPVSTGPLASVNLSTTSDVSISPALITTSSVRVRVKVAGAASDTAFTLQV
jgi:hypothetical protein